MRSYCEDYKKFLDAGKTERECVTEAVRLAEAKGFKPFTRGMAVNPGDKLYRINRGKALMLAVVGTRPLSEGVNIGAAHIDSPRWISSPTLSMRTRSWPFSRPTITAVSASTSG